MYHPFLPTFIAVAECGSFLKASEKLYISTPAVMKQINQLEQHLGLTLFVRTNHGVELTQAGRSIYRDAKQIIHLSDEAVHRAYALTRSQKYLIRIGTSVLYRFGKMEEIWSRVHAEYPQLHMKLIPFEDDSSIGAQKNLGVKYDLLYGVFDSGLDASLCSFYKTDAAQFCLGVPTGHPLSSRQLLRLSDLDGCTLVMMKPGNSPVNDRVRRRITVSAPSVRIVDAPHHYDVELFNRCAEENVLLLTLSAWSQVHPMLKTIPLDVPETIPMGVLSAPQPNESTAFFLEALRSCYKSENG